MSRLSLHVETETLPFEEPLAISGYTFDGWSVVVVTLSDGRVVGRGEACGVYYLGENGPSMAAVIESERAAIEGGLSRKDLRTLMPPGGARNAVDCALWDLEAKQLGKPVWQLAGLERPKPLLTLYTLGAQAPGEMAHAARAASSFRALKLKLTGDLSLDVSRVEAVRAARPDVWLSVDANQGYSAASLPEIVRCLIRADVSLFEQPVPRGREAELDGLECPIPIAADESMLHLGEMAALAGRFDVANIKLDKCGGLTEGLLMVAEARRMGLKTMIGNMSGSSWSMGPAFLVGQLCDFNDLDGPIHVVGDRSPAVRYESGYVTCDEAVWGGMR